MDANGRCRWILFLILISAAPLLAQSAGDWTLLVGADLNAPIVRGAFDANRGATWLATYGALYRVEEGKPRVVSKRPAPNAQLLLAPGGEVYAWVAVEGDATRILLLGVEGEPRAEIRAPRGAGPAGLILGFRGKLIVTAAPLDDPEGMRGRFRYTFWSEGGKELQSVVIDSPAVPILAGDGSAIALLGEKEAAAFSASGERLWSVGGTFRKGAISSGGKRAALNPSERKSINQVVVVTDGKPATPVILPTAVHHLAISPDGALLVAAGDRGRWFIVNGAARERPALRSTAGQPYIFDLELAGPDTIVFGLLHRRGEQSASWPAGSIVAVRGDGSTIVRRDFEIQEPTGFVPNVDVTWGESALVGSTRELSTLIGLKGAR